ncbi:MAG: endonuclease/exonuclease/phosphatase family protein [Microscillaceae bacterium]|nr:endonuclease/exonuclease/phosphatase family protein [Microscillaceae bacterium]
MLSITTLIVYSTSYISPANYPFLGFLSGFIPFFWVFNLFFFFTWLRFIDRRALLSGLTLLVGWNFLTASFSIGWMGSSTSKKSFGVLSYNVRVFNAYKHLELEKPGTSAHMINWLSKHPAEIKCFQEFYFSKTIPSLNTLHKIGKSKKYTYQLVYSESLRFKNQYIGLALFSKLPVVKSGDFPLNKPWTQRGVFMDILWEKDTLRIINVHLQSLSLDDRSLFDWQHISHTYRAYRIAYQKLRNGFQSRGQQVDYLEKFILQSPHKIILCGDLNDLPYSYTYQRLKKYFYNAFEVRGSGFNFTYKGKIPFLRIDNQFYSPGIRILHFETLYQHKESDHFPILANYELK